jgi:hypothetical protein
VVALLLLDLALLQPFVHFRARIRELR